MRTHAARSCGSLARPRRRADTRLAGRAPAASAPAATPRRRPPRPPRRRRPLRRRACDDARALQHVGGSPPFALVGGRIAVRGIVTPVRGRPDGQGELLPRRAQGGRQAACACWPIGNGAGTVPHQLLERGRGLVRGARGALRDAAAGRVQRARAGCALRQRRTSAPARAARPCGCCSPSSTCCTTPCR